MPYRGGAPMLLWFVAAATFSLVGLHAGITALRYLQLVELVVHAKAVGLALRSVSLRGRPAAEEWAGYGITAVVTVGKARKRGFDSRQVWLRRRDGRMVLLDRVEPLAINRPGTSGPERTLNQFAIGLSQELGVPIKHVALGWFRRWFST